MLNTRTRSGKGAVAGSFAAALIGIASFSGWFFRIEVLKVPIQGTAAVNPVTAVCLILGGGSLGLFLLAQNKPEQSPRTLLELIARAFAGQSLWLESRA